MGKADGPIQRVQRVAVLTLLCVVLAGCDDRKPQAQAKPAAKPSQDIADYAARRAGCNHWGGEEGMDAARRTQINNAMTGLKCGQIDQDEAGLLHRYSGQPQLQQQIRDAHDKLL